ncbi:MAG TPA: Gfo/Idh/MocA family oxidoreductase [Puia sp.]|nr:Gfo/Idh/MocA family oxidoreductase [Puia sp.]
MPRTDHNNSRRKFLQQLGGTGMLLSAAGLSSLAAGTGEAKEKMEEKILSAEKKTGPSDTLQIACIGMGIMGYNDVATALKVPGIHLVGVADLYTGRLQRAKELYGKDLFTTRDYHEILDRKDIDAVIIATSDNWHARIATEALQKGKSVYGEKPMVHRIEEGLPLIAAWQQSKKTMQIGSQRVSSVAYARARELYKAGEIGQLTCIEASFDRQSALGAWEYTQPTDGSPETVDWARYIAGTPQQPYDPKKFFWWRNYRAFGTGVAGDLFVHLLSGIHFITGSPGPEKIFSSGQIAYWKDGRDVPDVMTAIMHYPDCPEHPAFEVTLRVNFVSGQGETSTVKFIGSEGVLDMGYDGFTIRHHKMSVAPGIGGWDSLTTYPQAMQDELRRLYNQRYTPEQQRSSSPAPTVYHLPEGYDEDLEHFTNFFNSVRTGSPIVEDPIFGFRAAAPCLAANESYFQKKIISWDPVNMKLKA